MEFIVALFFLPILVTAIIKWRLGKRFDWQVFAVSASAGTIISIATYALGMASQTVDYEVLNGQVVSKTRDQVSCEHSYQCHCHPVRSCSGSGKSRSCSSSTECDTCYEHPFDVDWEVHSNIGGWNIDRIDRQGLREPPRWSVVKNGDPVSRTHMFTNYVKAVPESLYHLNVTHTFDNMIPAYPNNVYDYYKLDRALSIGVPVPDLKDWSNDISNILRTLGPAKQANIIVLFVKTADESYIHALEGAWLGGKKNDIIVVIGTTQYPKIDWVGISSWTDKAMLKVQLRDDIMSLQTIDRAKIIQAIQTDTMKLFERKQMADFEYLKYEIQPPDWVLTLAIILGILIPVVIAVVIYRNNRWVY